MHGPQADVVAAGLLGVAGEARLLVAPDRLGRHHEDQDSEDEDDRQPDAADAGGMPVYDLGNNLLLTMHLTGAAG
uniref:Uncharacterized protein n=1 Tax=Oncorhynchus mykiss TaxID=8022 RepID=A0A8C7TC99_ONCMY